MLIVISLLKFSFNYFDRLIEEQEHEVSMQKSLKKRLFWNPGSISLLVDSISINQLRECLSCTMLTFRSLLKSKINYFSS